MHGIADKTRLETEPAPKRQLQSRIVRGLFGPLLTVTSISTAIALYETLLEVSSVASSSLMLCFLQQCKNFFKPASSAAADRLQPPVLF